jgi:putative PIN family toxin of toxin-antitoxin system
MVVFDTNVWVSALVFRGRDHGLLDRWVLGEFKVAISPDLLAETTRVLSGRKFGVPPEVLTTRDNEIRKKCLAVYPTQRLQVIKADPTDDRVLECAVAAKAEIIVSGDAHLLSLGEYQGIRILDPTAFLAELDGPITGAPQAQEAPALYRVKGKKKKPAKRRKT